MSRLTRDQMLMAMAHVASARGTCNRLHVGAVIAHESRPVSIGYNGAPSGAPHCGSHCNEHNPCTNTIHAEDNAIRWARAFGIDLRGATIYITDSPCPSCAKKIVDSGITRVVFDRPYRDLSPLGILTQGGVEYEQCHVEPVVNATYLSSQITPVYGELESHEHG